MAVTEIQNHSRSIQKPVLAASLVILIWLGYTVMQTYSVLGGISQELYAILGFVPGIAGVGILIKTGVSRESCYLQNRRLSRVGLAVLAAVFIFALATVLPFGVWDGWNWQAVLFYAPTSGISQELFFRSALLPAMGLLFRRRTVSALVAHAVLFGLWRIDPLFLGAPLWAVFAVIFVPFLSGIGWGWQAQHDGTVVWAMVQHSLIWVVGLQFPMPA